MIQVKSKSTTDMKKLVRPNINDACGCGRVITLLNSEYLL